MKTLILIILAIVTNCSIAAAQFLTKTIDPKQFGIELEGKPVNWKTYVNADAVTGTAVISLMDREMIYYFLADKNFTITSWFAVNKDTVAENYYSDKFEMIQQVADNGKFYNFFKRVNGSEIVREDVDFATKTVHASSFIDYNSREKFLTSYIQDGQVYFLMLVKRTYTLKLYSNSNAPAKEITLEKPSYLPDLDLEDLLKHMQVIKQDKESSLYDAKESAKLYVGANKSLWLSFDDNFRYTLLFKINLDNLSSSSKVISKNLSRCSGVDKTELLQTNTFIYNHYLFQAIFCPNDLLIAVKDILTDSLIREYHAYRDSSITFAGSDLIKREENTKTSLNFWGLGTNEKPTNATVKERALKSKDFFRVVSNHDLSLIIVPVNGELVLKIGEAHDINKAQGGGMMWTGGGMPGGGGYTYFAGGYNDTWKAETYFKTQLNAADFSYIPKAADETLYDKIDDVKNLEKDFQAASATFDFNGRTWFLYWHKEDRNGIVKMVN